MISFFKALVSPWTWSMAYRDSRASRWKLALFSASIIFGVAALVVIGSLRHNLNDSVKSQSKSLLGADLQLSARKEFSKEAKDLTAKIGGDQAKEISFATMMTVGENPQPRLVNIRGIESGFPFYGTVATTPADAWQRIYSAPSGGVLVEESLLLSMQSKIGDTVKIGKLELPIIGTLDQAPPSASGFAGMNPTVVTSYDIIKNSELLSSKSLSFHRTYFKLPALTADMQISDEFKAAFDAERLRSVTATQRSERIEKTINNLYLFLNLIGFSSLFLGGIGIAGAIHIHISERLSSVATLRCLGCTSAKAFAIYFIQGVCMGALGTLLGLAAGCGLIATAAYFAQSLPDVIPFEITIEPVFTEIVKAAGIGFIISVCFALLPLLKLRKISPLAALRNDGADSDLESGQKSGFLDPLRWLIILTLAATAFLLAWLDNRELGRGLATAAGYVGFLAVTFGLLLGCGFFLRWILRLCVRPSWPITIRQGFSALYRPNNQTSIFMLSIGLGVFFLFTLVFMQNVLLQWLSPQRLADQPNIFMVDIPPEDTAKARETIQKAGSTPLADAPIIQLRLTAIKGKSVDSIFKEQAEQKKKSDKASKDKGGQIPKWVLRRSFRSTFRSELSDTEQLVSGEWIGTYDATQASPNSLIPISIEAEIAENLGVKIGDTISMEIEGFGESIDLKIASIRTVDWRSMNLNFFIVLPKGAVDDYVAFNILTAHSPSPEARAELQQAMFAKWPSVSVVDLSLILKTVQSVLNAAGKSIQAMALFTIITGSIVLISTLLSGRKIRSKEIVLLRTLGASQGQIARILAIEYTLLASIATIAGTSLAAIATALLSSFLFENDAYTFPWSQLLIGATTVIVITVTLGMLLSRGIANTPPMHALKDG